MPAKIDNSIVRSNYSIRYKIIATNCELSVADKFTEAHLFLHKRDKVDDGNYDPPPPPPDDKI